MAQSVSSSFDMCFFDQLAAAPLKYSGFHEGVQCFVHVHGEDHSVSIESKSLARKFWIWVTGAKEEYNLEANIEYLADKIQGGIQKIVEGPVDPATVRKIAACYKRYQLLVPYYASHHSAKERYFSSIRFERQHTFQPLNGLLREYEETLQRWQEEGTDIQKLLAAGALNQVKNGKLEASKITYSEAAETNFSTIIRKLFSDLHEVTHLTDCSAGDGSQLGVQAWFEKMESEKGYIGFAYDLYSLRREWDELSLFATKAFLETPLAEMKNTLEKRLDTLHARQLAVQKKLDEFRASEEFAKSKRTVTEDKP
jgi:hypothetical protein